MKRKKGDKYIGRGGIEIEVLGDAEDVTDEEMARVNQMAQIADEEDRECRVNFRWTKEQLAVVKEVADKVGIPYQAYIKQVLFERASDDLRRLGSKAPTAAYVPLSDAGTMVRESKVSKERQHPDRAVGTTSVDRKRLFDSISVVCEYLASIAERECDLSSGGADCFVDSPQKYQDLKAGHSKKSKKS